MRLIERQIVFHKYSICRCCALGGIFDVHLDFHGLDSRANASPPRLPGRFGRAGIAFGIFGLKNGHGIVQPVSNGKFPRGTFPAGAKHYQFQFEDRPSPAVAVEDRIAYAGRGLQFGRGQVPVDVGRNALAVAIDVSPRFVAVFGGELARLHRAPEGMRITVPASPGVAPRRRSVTASVLSATRLKSSLGSKFLSSFIPHFFILYRETASGFLYPSSLISHPSSFLRDSLRSHFDRSLAASWASHQSAVVCNCFK